jgi:hypothetical protein
MNTIEQAKQVEQQLREMCVMNYATDAERVAADTIAACALAGEKI